MPLLRARELGDIIDKAQPDAGAVRCEAAGRTGARARAPGAGHVVPFNAPDAPGSLAVRARGSKERRVPACPTAADDIALLAFTSGTTGKPKAAVHTHRDVLAPASLAAARAARHARRHRDRLAAAGLHLRARRAAGVPDVGRRFGLLPDAPYTPGVAGAPSARWARPSATPRPPSTARPRRSRASTASRAAHQRERRRRPARRHAPAVEAGRGIEMLDGIGATEMFHIFISVGAGADVRRGASARWCRATPRRWSTTGATRCRAAPSASWP
jgi:2-aminobenzoate-CoA ligase